MDRSELAKQMLRWEKVQAQADRLKAAIVDSVLQLGETVTAGNVTASYSGGRKSYNYQAAADGHPMVGDATKSLFTKTRTTIDWRGICKHAGIEDVPFTQSDPSVTVKLLS